MANSKHRKRQIAANRKQLENAKMKFQKQNSSCERQARPRKQSEDDKENIQQAGNSSRNSPDVAVSSSREACHEIQQASEGAGWLTGLYDWCQSGINQVVTQVKTTVVL